MASWIKAGRLRQCITCYPTLPRCSTPGEMIFWSWAANLSASTQLSRPWRYYHRNLFERIELFGVVDLLGATAPDRPVLRDCPCEDEPCRHVQTHQHPRSKVPWHNDYLYATQKMAERLISCEVVEAGHPPWVVERPPAGSR